LRKVWVTEMALAGDDNLLMARSLSWLRELPRTLEHVHIGLSADVWHSWSRACAHDGVAPFGWLPRVRSLYWNSSMAKVGGVVKHLPLRESVVAAWPPAMREGLHSLAVLGSGDAGAAMHRVLPLLPGLRSLFVELSAPSLATIRRLCDAASDAALELLVLRYDTCEALTLDEYAAGFRGVATTLRELRSARAHPTSPLPILPLPCQSPTFFKPDLVLPLPCLG